jgi:hypothetical protein
VPANFVLFIQSDGSPIAINADLVRCFFEKAHDRKPGKKTVALVFDQRVDGGDQRVDGGHVVVVEGDLKTVWEKLAGPTPQAPRPPFAPSSRRPNPTDYPLTPP